VAAFAMAAMIAGTAEAQLAPPPDWPTPAPSTEVAPIATLDPADADRARAVQCLATAIAYEAGNEPLEGQQAVAEVILNRARAGVFARDPATAKTVCGVVFAGSERRTGCQFTFTCDGSLRRHLSDRMIAATRLVAEAAIDGRNPSRVSGAAWYHADYVSPYWAPSLVRVAKIGAHIFYRAPGLGDRMVGPGVYNAKGEPVIGALAAATAAVVVAAKSSAPAAAVAPPAFSLWGLKPGGR
jgi:spore germination cell wall hydrolase CwlJ-like protein